MRRLFQLIKRVNDKIVAVNIRPPARPADDGKAKFLKNGHTSGAGHDAAHVLRD